MRSILHVASASARPVPNYPPRERRAGTRSDDARPRGMNIERIVSSSERGFVERSVDYIESCMNTHHAQSPPTAGCFVLGVSGPNGRVRRERALDTFTELAARENIAWERVRVFLVDERYGELPTEEDSNAHLMRCAFGKRLPEVTRSLSLGLSLTLIVTLTVTLIVALALPYPWP